MYWENPPYVKIQSNLGHFYTKADSLVQSVAHL